MKAVNLIFFALTHGSFIWAALFFFKVSDDGAKKGKNIISILGSLFIALQFFSIFFHPQQNNLISLIASTLYVVSIFLFYATLKSQKNNSPSFAFSKTVPEKIITSGPYQFVRHPFYTSYTLAWIAGALASETAYSITALLMIYLYLRSAAKEETCILQSPNNELYTNYMKKTKMLIPFVY